MRELISAAFRAAVKARARGRCEYCLFAEEDLWAPHEPDHVIALKHRGFTALENLAFACFACNRFKGTDLASFDLVTGRIVRLFNPRRDLWKRHFRLQGARIVPRTAVGRVTEFLLQFNRSDIVLQRAALIAQGLFPG